MIHKYFKNSWWVGVTLLLILFLYSPGIQAVDSCGNQTTDCTWCGMCNPCICDGTCGNCVWYAWHKACKEWGHAMLWSIDSHLCDNATNWDYQAWKWDYPTGDDPLVQSIFVCNASDRCSVWGHVGWVEAAYPDGSFDTTEQYWGGPCGTLSRHREAGYATGGFIYEPSGERDNSQLVSETIPPDTVLNPGQTFTKSWTLENTGTTTWSSEGNYALSFDGDEQFGAPETTPISEDTSVDPGETYVWEIEMTAPEAYGSYTGYWIMSHDGNRFGERIQVSIIVAPRDQDNDGYAEDVDCDDLDPDVHPDATELCNGINDDCDNDTDEGCVDKAEFVSETIPDGTIFQVGETFTKRWSIKNTGNTTWTSPDYYWAFQSGHQLGAPEQILLPAQTSVPPDTIYDWNVEMTAPNEPGTYRGYWSMEHNGKPFGSKIWVEITVMAPHNDAKFISETIPDRTEFFPEEDFLKSWTIQNIGSTIWSHASGYVWAFQNGTQLGAPKHTFMAEDISVLPNDNLEWDVPMIAPKTPGIYRGYWQMEQNGIPFGHKVWVEIRVTAHTNDSRFISETIPDRSRFSPGEPFVKSWTIKNTGTSNWTFSDNYSWAFQRGDPLDAPNQIPVPENTSVPPNTSFAWKVEMVAPKEPGLYRGYWRMEHNGEGFGTLVWVEITVIGPNNNLNSYSDTMSTNMNRSLGSLAASWPAPTTKDTKADDNQNSLDTSTSLLGCGCSSDVPSSAVWNILLILVVGICCHRRRKLA